MQTQGQEVILVTITTQERITRELARLRMEQLDCDPDELGHKTDLAHDRINVLLDQLDAEHSQKEHATSQ